MLQDKVDVMEISVRQKHASDTQMNTFTIRYFSFIFIKILYELNVKMRLLALENKIVNLSIIAFSTFCRNHF